MHHLHRARRSIQILNLDIFPNSFVPNSHEDWTQSLSSPHHVLLDILVVFLVPRAELTNFFYPLVKVFLKRSLNILGFFLQDVHVVRQSCSSLGGCSRFLFNRVTELPSTTSQNVELNSVACRNWKGSNPTFCHSQIVGPCLEHTIAFTNLPSWVASFHSFNKKTEIVRTAFLRN